MVCVCALALILMQPLVTLYTKMMLGHAAAELSRVVATAQNAPDSKDSGVLTAWAADRLEGLPKGRAFMLPGSLKVSVSGTAHSDVVYVKVSVRQEPLPLFAVLATLTGKRSVEVSAQASAAGALCGVEGSPAAAPQVFGKTE
jgi:hypothetical protein